MKRVYSVLLFLSASFFAACQADTPFVARPDQTGSTSPAVREDPALSAIGSDTIRKVLESALEQPKVTKGYTQDYIVIPYPNGDVSRETGACTDVVIRAFRNAGVDLQREVHEDMASNFSAYPSKWGLARPDSNIDHRRVPNLQTYFSRRGKSVPVSTDAKEYKPGDVVSWDLDGKGMTHIGLVSNLWSEKTKRYLIIHNIGGGTKAEDRLFEWKVTGHYRYF
jgi:uncharacterized protein YijF (DUF1287 family)